MCHFKTLLLMTSPDVWLILTQHALSAAVTWLLSQSGVRFCTDIILSLPLSCLPIGGDFRWDHYAVLLLERTPSDQLSIISDQFSIISVNLSIMWSVINNLRALINHLITYQSSCLSCSKSKTSSSLSSEGDNDDDEDVFTASVYQNSKGEVYFLNKVIHVQVRTMTRDDIT